MPFRFRRSIRFAPGVRLSIGKRGISATVGARAAHVTVGHDRTRATVSTPVPGVSYTASTATRRRNSTPVTWTVRLCGAAIVLALAWWFGWL